MSGLTCVAVSQYCAAPANLRSEDRPTRMPTCKNRGAIVVYRLTDSLSGVPPTIEPDAPAPEGT